MRARMLSFAAAAAVVAVALPSHAATAARPQIVDPAGDANALNGQGFVAGGPFDGTATPTDYSSGDITGVRFQTVLVKKGRKRVPTATTITLTLAAAPGPQLTYRVAATTPTCQDAFFEYGTAAGGADPGSARCAASVTEQSRDIAVSKVAVVGNSIVWTVPLSSLPLGTKLTALNAQTRVTTATPAVTVTAPQVDYAASAATFTVGK